MKRNEFIAILRKKLSVLDGQEVNDIIVEYNSHIEEKIENDKTEEEAIADFGDIDILVKEILSAYKINNNYDNKSDFEQNIDNFVDKAIQFFKSFAKKLEEKDTKEIIDIIIKVIIVLIIVSIFASLFSLLNNSIISMFRALPIGEGIFVPIWSIISSFLGLILTVLFLYYGIKYLLNKELHISEHINSEIEKEKTKKEKKDLSKKDYHNDIKELKREKDEIKETYSNKSPLYITCSIILKVFAVIISIPLICAVIGLAIVFALFIGLIFEGIIMYDVLFILAGLIVIFSSISGIINHIAFKVVK